MRKDKTLYKRYVINVSSPQKDEYNHLIKAVQHKYSIIQSRQQTYDHIDVIREM